MPSSVQIVPKYDFSYVETYIYDNTQVIDPADEVDDSYKTVHLFRSGKGISNKLVKLKSQKDFEDIFGKTDYAKYGQPLMMPYATLSSGEATAYCMRIMPEDAPYANDGLFVYYRTAMANITEPILDEDGDVTYGPDGITPATQTVARKMFQVMFRHSHVDPLVDPENNVIITLDGNGGVTSIADMERHMKTFAKNLAAIEPPVENEDGTTTESAEKWKCLPFAWFLSVGSGDYGNSYRWKFTRDIEREEDNYVKTYNIGIIDSSHVNMEIATYNGSLITANVNRTSTFINDVINSYSNGEYPVDIHIYEETIDTLYDEYVKFLGEVAAADPTETIVIPEKKEFDPVFAIDFCEDTSCKYLMVVKQDDEGYPIPDDPYAVDFSDPIGMAMGGGHDGSFATIINNKGNKVNGALEKMDVEMYKDAMRKGITHLKYGEATKEDYVYALQFFGYGDRALLSTKRTPADYLLDANYSYLTKISFAKWVMTRNSAPGYLDTGLDFESFSYSVLRSFERRYRRSGLFEHRLLSISTNKGKVEDIFSARRVEVTMTYDFAKNLPIHFRTYGIHVPYAKSHAILTGFVKKSITPVLDSDTDADVMQQLTKLPINFVEAVDENQCWRAIQNTSNEFTSDLTEENNVRVVYWFKRMIERDLIYNHYNFADAADRQAFKRVEEAKYRWTIGSMVNSLSIDFDMNAFEGERQILHCYLAMQMRTLHKRSIVEIDVNKRDF